jgi:hypothetical protein
MSKTQYAIFYHPITLGELDRSRPIAAITLNDGVLTLVGDEDFISRWSRYFYSPSWDYHVDEGGDEALTSLFGRTTYASCDVLGEDNGPTEFAKVKKIKDIKTSTVKP